jgi:hypothetical protein
MEEALLSFGSPRQGFSTSVHSSVDKRQVEEEGGKDAAELLAFYRQRCEQFHAEREQTLAHLAQIEVRGALERCAACVIGKKDDIRACRCPRRKRIDSSGS